MNRTYEQAQRAGVLLMAPAIIDKNIRLATAHSQSAVASTNSSPWRLMRFTRKVLFPAEIVYTLAAALKTQLHNPRLIAKWLNGSQKPLLWKAPEWAGRNTLPLDIP
jgi:hypothetical protein